MLEKNKYIFILFNNWLVAWDQMRFRVIHTLVRKYIIKNWDLSKWLVIVDFFQTFSLFRFKMPASLNAEQLTFQLANLKVELQEKILNEKINFT